MVLRSGEYIVQDRSIGVARQCTLDGFSCRDIEVPVVLVDRYLPTTPDSLFDDVEPYIAVGACIHVNFDANRYVSIVSFIQCR